MVSFTLAVLQLEILSQFNIEFQFGSSLVLSFRFVPSRFCKDFVMTFLFYLDVKSLPIILLLGKHSKIVLLAIWLNDFTCLEWTIFNKMR